MKLKPAEKWLFAIPPLLLVAIWGIFTMPNKLRDDSALPTAELPLVSLDSASSMSLSNNGKVLVTGGYTTGPARRTVVALQLWDAQNLDPLPPIPGVGSVFEMARCVSLSPDGQILAWSIMDSTKQFIFTNIKSGNVLWKWPGRSGNVVFSPDGKWVASSNGPTQVREARTGRLIQNWNSSTVDPSGCALFSPGGHWFATTGPGVPFKQWKKSKDLLKNGPSLELRRTKDWKLQRTLDLYNASHLAFSPDDQNLVALTNSVYAPGGVDGSQLRFFELSTGKVRWELNSRSETADPRLQFIRDLCFTPDGKSVLVSAISGIFQLNASNGHITRTFKADFEGAGTAARDLAISPDGKKLFTRGKKSVSVWDL